MLTSFILKNCIQCITLETNTTYLDVMCLSNFKFFYHEATKMLVTSLHYLTQDEYASVISESMNTITTNKLNLNLCAITRKNFVSNLSVLITLVVTQQTRDECI